MNIKYEYEIIRVDEQHRCMEVVYTSDGRETLHVSARLPYLGEALETVVSQFAPIGFWREKAATVVPPTVGLKGECVYDEQVAVQPEKPATLESAKAQKMNELKAWRYARETGGVTFSGLTFATDRDSQHKLFDALAGVRAGFFETVSWKAADGQWATLDVEMLAGLAREVFGHVQASYQMEKAYGEIVSSAATIEEVNNIVFSK